MRWMLLMPIALTLGVARQAIAHGVDIQYQFTPAFEVVATYDTGALMANAQVVVFAPDTPAEPWLTSTTDGAGRFIFTPNHSGNWEVQIRQAGHGDIVTIPVGMASADSAAPNPANLMAAKATNTTFTPLQKGIMIGSVIWGCVGTALFFARGKKSVNYDAHS